MATQTVFIDDADAFVSWTITDALGQDLDWSDPQIALGDAAYGVASWEGVAGPTREIRLSIPLGLGLPRGTYPAYLKVPSGVDFELGVVRIVPRT